MRGRKISQREQSGRLKEMRASGLAGWLFAERLSGSCAHCSVPSAQCPVRTANCELRTTNCPLPIPIGTYHTPILLEHYCTVRGRLIRRPAKANNSIMALPASLRNLITAMDQIPGEKVYIGGYISSTLCTHKPPGPPHDVLCIGVGCTWTREKGGGG
ncbi:hypothetical protein BZA05DRAFT_168091 [Tricharina praecox]|uniref:uncharacterized protein n=1 Tax=Tricharina praecox TaxID=43433 RepID=UPI00221E4F8B|nr:uncharacterized protein BZA05DRAFT_168091 [Tricharina praecox]KAI5857184.1 hypothetical protein BZA05DRAFT_168091 [Tricharina praecox]